MNIGCRHKVCLALLALLPALLGGPGISAASTSGGARFEPPPPPPKKAMIRDGRAIAPRRAPHGVRRVIAAANRLVRKPYRWGGGHGALLSAGSTAAMTAPAP